MSPSDPKPALSVVLIGRNEGDRLIRCLESVRQMTPLGGPIEVLYVDSASSDDSVERARAAGAEVLEVHPERPAAAIGRNAGWRAARADLVLFLDGDTILHPDFVASSIGAFDDPRIGVVWGHRREIDPASSVFNRVLDLDWIYPPGQTDFCGGDALVRRSALDRVGGFDDELIAGEEPELCQRLRSAGYVVLHVDRPMTGHDLAITRFRQYWRRAERAGHAYAEVSARFRSSDIPLWEKESRRNRAHGALLTGLVIGSAVASAWAGSVWPLAVGLGILIALVVRTASRVRWKSDDWGTRVLYGLHSHVQQIPILVGQLKYAYFRRAGSQRGLIEYKEAPSR